MILARTNMKEMPERCQECICFVLDKSDENTWYGGFGKCGGTGETVFQCWERPDWCPLVEAVRDEELS